MPDRHSHLDCSPGDRGLAESHPWEFGKLRDSVVVDGLTMRTPPTGTRRLYSTSVSELASISRVDCRGAWLDRLVSHWCPPRLPARHRYSKQQQQMLGRFSRIPMLAICPKAGPRRRSGFGSDVGVLDEGIHDGGRILRRHGFVREIIQRPLRSDGRSVINNRSRLYAIGIAEPTWC